MICRYFVPSREVQGRAGATEQVFMNVFPFIRKLDFKLAVNSMLVLSLGMIIFHFLIITDVILFRIV
jgi:hypothetical protein